MTWSFGQAADDATAPPVPTPAPSSNWTFAKAPDDTLARAQAVTVANAQVPPQTAASAATLAPQVGLPQAVVETDVPRFQQQAQAQRSAATLAASPVLASWVAANPDGARVAQSEYDKLSTIEKAWDFTKYTGTQLLGATAELVKPLVAAGGAQFMLADYLRGDTALQDWYFRNALDPVQQTIDAAQEGHDLGFGHKAVAAASQLVGTLAAAWATGGTAEAPAAVGVGTKLLGHLATAARGMALPSLSSAVDTGENVYGQTSDPALAIRAALAQYGLTTLGGAVPLSMRGSLFTRLLSGGASGLATGEISREAMNAILPEQLRQNYDPDQAIFNAVTGAVLGGVLGPRAEPELQSGVRQQFGQTFGAEQALDAQQRLGVLSEAVQGSKLKEAAPGALRRFVEMVTDGSPLEAVYVDPAKLGAAFAQSGVEPAPDLAQRIREATAASTDVRLPIADYAASIAGTPAEKALLPDMRAAPDGVTFGEAEQHLQQAGEQMQSRAEEIKAQRAARTAFETDKATVSQNVFEQLQATGRNPEAVNKAYATLISEHYGALASREGVKPSELYKRLPLTIAAEGSGLQQSGQRGAYSPEQRTMALLQGSDLTTVLHESGHLFLDNLEQLAGGSKSAGADMDLLLRHFGEQGATPEERLASWTGKTLEQKREIHEKFAEGFEHYLMEGTAPSETLRTLFGRFRSWLLSVYQHLRGAAIDPEVRGVMDRMLASDQAIKDTEAQRGYAPLFESAQAMGVGADEFNRYVEQGQQATEAAVSKLQAQSLKDMKWASGAKSKALAALQRQADAARREVRGQVENDVAQHPAFQAQDWMHANAGQSAEFKEAAEAWRAQREQQGAHLREQLKAELYASHPEAKGLAKGQLLAKSRKAIDAAVQQRLSEWEQANPRPRPEDRSDLEFVAAMHGFDSGDAMRQAILEAGDRQDVVRAETDRRMLAEHGELVDRQSMEQAANAAVHNEARSRFMATGLKALMRSPLSATQLARAARAAAEQIVAGQRIGELRSDIYRAAETRANREALAAAAKEPAKAIEAQRTALLNNRLAAAAQDAQDEIAKGLKFLRRFDRPTPDLGKRIGADYLDRINEILSRYDVAARFNSIEAQSQRLELRDWVQKELDRTGVAPQIPDSIVDFAARRHWKELSVEEFRGLLDAVKSLEHVGREQSQLTLAGKKVALEEKVAEAKARLADMEHRPPVDLQPHLEYAKGLDKISVKLLSAKQKISSGFAALTKMEQLFQWLDHGRRAGLAESSFGPFQEMFKLAAHAEGRERSMRKVNADQVKALNKLLTGINENEALTIPELPRKNRGAQWYRGELLSAALNTGNESNLRKLAAGYGWDTAVLDRALDKHLSDAEWKWAQGVWDVFGQYGEPVRELQRRQTGIAPPMIEARHITNSHGSFNGGYYPVVYDAFEDRGAERRQAKNAAALFENQFAQPTTSKGHTVARTDYVGPIHLSLQVIGRQLEQVTHDLAWREPVADINKFLTHPEIVKEIDETMGRSLRKQLRPWLQALANDKVFNTSGDSAWERFIMKARTNSTMVGLGFRPSTMEIHGLSALSNSIAEIGPKWLAKGAAEFGTGPWDSKWQAGKAFMYERSPEMANRFNELDRNIHEAVDMIKRNEQRIDPLSATQRAVDGARRYAFYGISALDMASAAPTWMGGYLRALATKERGGLGLGEDAAIDYANRAVRNAHGGGGVKDMSAVQRDKGVMSLFTLFYSYWNHVVNRQMDIARGYSNLGQSVRQGTGTRDFAALLARSWWYFVVPQLIHAMLKSSTPSEEQEDESTHIASELAMGFVGGVPVVRDFVNAAVRKFVTHQGDYTMSPIEQAGKTIVDATVDTAHAAVGEPTSQHPLRNVAQAAGYLAGLPTGQPSQTATFLWDVWDGDVAPQDIRDWYEGVQTGRMHP